jgi:uncharacterized protein Usg
MSNLLRQLQGYCLVTAEIIYHLPDYPKLLQSYIWQEYDKLPDFPTLQRFLMFWEKNLEGKVHSITVTHSELIKPVEFHVYQRSWQLH